MWTPNPVGLLSLQEEGEAPGIPVREASCKPIREASGETNSVGTVGLRPPARRL